MLSALLLCCVGSSICTIAYVIQLLIKDRPGLALFFFFCGGGLFAFVHGWTTVRDWNNQPMMIAWTLCLVGSAALFLLTLAPLLLFFLLAFSR
jgi:hypothetical protein